MDKQRSYLSWLTYASLMSLALGLFTSMTFLALTHIFIIIPCFYFLNKTNYKNWNKSSWFLLGLIGAIILSVIFNQDISVRGYAPLSKSKYYLLALLSITPFSFYFKNLANDDGTWTKKIYYLLMALMITTTVATISGMIGVFTGYNPLIMKVMTVARNGGLAGMLMNYAQNLAFFQIIVTGLIYYRADIKKYINLNFLYAVWLINALGLYTTYTRGALLAFLVAVPFFFFKEHKKKFISVFIFLFISGTVIYNVAGKAFLRPGSDVERLSQWKAAWAGFKERPVFGLGYLNFEQMAIPLKIKYNIEAVHFGGHAHSNYFEMLASTGLVGFTFFLLWQIAWFIEMYKRDDIIAKIGLPFIVVFVIGGLTQATFALGANLFFIMPVYALTQINFKTIKD